MKIIKKKNLTIILLVWLIIPLFLSVPKNSFNYEDVSVKRAGWGSNADWYEEGNKSTTEVDITYTGEQRRHKRFNGTEWVLGPLKPVYIKTMVVNDQKEMGLCKK